MQTILGSGGAIGIELARALKPYTDSIRLVSRNPQKVNASDHLFSADLSRQADVLKAVNGSEIAYLTETVFKNLSKGKKAMWLASVKHRHSFTYTPDAAKATALLGNTADAYNQVWHLPTAPNPLTGKEWIHAIAEALGVEPKYQVVPKFLVRIIGLFMPIMKETVEMMYQYERDYVFDSSKFEKSFGFEPTPYLEGIRNIVEDDY